MGTLIAVTLGFAIGISPLRDCLVVQIIVRMEGD